MVEVTGSNPVLPTTYESPVSLWTGGGFSLACHGASLRKHWLNAVMELVIAIRQLVFR